MDWKKAQEWERSWWGNCCNTLGEETKQLLYADRMGLKAFHDGKSPYNFDLGGASVLDIGGGPCSLLLKCVNLGKGTAVLDPIEFPTWVVQRYGAAGIGVLIMRGEDADWMENYDECWIYNVLQHAEDPGAVLKNARRAGKLIRIFEWLDMQPTESHPHTLTRTWLNEQLGGEGKVEVLSGQSECYGRSYYGVFPA